MASVERHLPQVPARYWRVGAGSLSSRPELSGGGPLGCGAVRQPRIGTPALISWSRRCRALSSRGNPRSGDLPRGGRAHPASFAAVSPSTTPELEAWVTPHNSV